MGSRTGTVPTSSSVAVAIGAGIVLAIAYTAAPLTVWALVAAAVLLRFAGRGLSDRERRALTATLVTALAVRLAAIGALAVAGAIRHADPSLGAILTGDEAYVLGRALRTRDILLGVAFTKFDYVVVFDDYARNSYLGVLTWLQVVFGPTPYGMRLLNAVMFMTATVLLFRTARRAFGWLPAYIALLVMLFYPTLFVWSISLLKEPLYLLGTSLVFVSTITAIRAPRWRARLWAAAGAATGVGTIVNLRPGAIGLAAGGIALGLAIRLAASTRTRLAAAAALVVVGTAVAATVPAAQRPAIAALEITAKQHAGHVFTVGHAYKTLDEGFYVTPQTPVSSSLTLTVAQAARYVLRSAATFLLVPLPWQVTSSRELAYMPEQLVWYLTLVLAPFGVAAGWRRDPLVTALLAGFVVPSAAAIALTDGNVGTLLRLRGVIVPYLAPIMALGLCQTIEILASRRDAAEPGLAGLDGLRP
jgi:4-amino-4-deoxy-L-arabinose transferase-like glycosyltransferase